MQGRLKRSMGSPLVLVAALLWGIALPVFTRLSQNGLKVDLPCLFKQWSGIPCPGCRGTRAALSLGNGQVPEAFVWNPLATLFLLGVPLLLMGTFFGVHHQVHAKPKTVFITLGVGALLVGANWLYVIWVGG